MLNDPEKTNPPEIVTLILLFSISGIIITRSYLLRRRFRLRVEEALRNGQVLSPDVPGLVGLSTSATRKLFGPPPKLWDIWVQPAIPVRMTEMVGMVRGESQDVYEGGAEISGEFPWDAMTVSRSFLYIRLGCLVPFGVLAMIAHN